MAYRVIEHTHSEAEGVYRLVIGREVFDEEEVIGYDDIRDIVFHDGDPRWFDKKGNRLNDHEIATQQLDTIRGHLNKEAEIPTELPKLPRKMPGENLKI